MNKHTILSIFLLAASGAAAQPQARFDATSLDLGTVLWNKERMATFTVTNVGNKSLVINNVETSCGCTEATWTKSPIKAGKTGTISVAYTADMLGHFNKQLAVYTNADPRPVYLSLKGVVSTDAPEYDGEYLYKMGNIGVNVNEMIFDNVNLGDQPQLIIEVFNGGSDNYKPELMHLPNYLTAQAVPEELGPGKGGKIVVTLDSRKLREMGLTQTSVYLSRYPGDKVCKDTEIEVSAVLLPSFENLTEAQLAAAPAIELSTEKLVLENPGKKKKTKGNITITNTGKSTLNIKSLQVFNSALNVDVKRKIAPGESTKLNIAVIMRYLKRSKRALRVLMITNDPKRPKIDIDVTIGK